MSVTAFLLFYYLRVTLNSSNDFIISKNILSENSIDKDTVLEQTQHSQQADMETDFILGDNATNSSLETQIDVLPERFSPKESAYKM